MKINVLILSLFLATGQAVVAQPAKPLVYTPDEMEVLNEMHGEYTRVSNEILGVDKDSGKVDEIQPVGDNEQTDSLSEDDDDEFVLLDTVKNKLKNKLKSFAPESSWKSLLPFLAACCALYFKGGLGQILNNASLAGVGEANYKFDRYWSTKQSAQPAIDAYNFGYACYWRKQYELNNHIRRGWPKAEIELDKADLSRLKKVLTGLEQTMKTALEPCNAAWKEFSGYLYSGWDKSGIGYAIAAGVGTSLLIGILTGILSEETTTSLSSLTKLEKSVRRILSDEHKLDKDFREAAYDEMNAGFFLIDKNVRPEFREGVIKALERDYLLFYDKITKDRERGSKIGVNFISGALRVAIMTLALTWNLDYFKKSFVFGVLAFFALNYFILPTKDDDEKSEVLADIYKIINEAKTRHFEYVKQNAQIQEMEIKNTNAVTTTQSQPQTAATVEIKQSRLRRFLNLFSRKNNKAVEKKTAEDEVKTEVANVEKDMELNAKIQQDQRKMKKVALVVGAAYLSIFGVVIGFACWQDYQNRKRWN